MEKLSFTLDDGNTVDFFVLEQTRINGVNYLLVTEEEEGDADALILKDLSSAEDQESQYEIVSEEEELNAVAQMFESLLDDITFVEGE